MRRHVTLPDGRKDEPPGSTNWTTAYGSAIHMAIHLVETEGLTNQQAVERVWPEYGGYLDPEELQMLKEDMDAYRGDTPIGWELIAAEVDVRVPLFTRHGVQYYFRFKIDALYRRIDDHTAFLMRDYKSSKHRRTQADVDKDPQMWAYNFGIHELYPECASLIQSYEQLRFGNLTTSKNANQRTQVKAWLIETVKAVLGDEEMKPKQNQWCAYCRFVVTCDETERATRYWRGVLSVIAPKVKEGRRTKIAFADEGDELERVIEKGLPRMTATRKHIEAVESALKDVIEAMPSDERERLGWRLADRKSKILTPDGLRAMHEALGDRFYEVVSMSRSGLETVVGKPAKGEPVPPELELLREMELERVSSTSIVAAD